MAKTKEFMQGYLKALKDVEQMSANRFIIFGGSLAAGLMKLRSAFIEEFINGGKE